MERTITVGGRPFSLRTMTGERLADFTELGLLAAAQKVLALQLSQSGDLEQTTEAVRRLVLAGGIQVMWALGCDAEFALSLEARDQRFAVDVQTELNGHLEQQLDTQAMAATAYLEASVGE